MGLGPYPGGVAVWNGTVWETRQLYGCPDPNSCNYVGNWSYPLLADPAMCLYGTPNCPLVPCDDGNALTFADTLDASGTVCSGIPCSGVDCSGAGPCAGVSHVLFDLKVYALVEIGSQCWFKENLAADNYRNGDAIPGGLTDIQWISTTFGAQAVHNNDAATLATYGRLYNFPAVADPRGLCPTGYHVPSDDEWSTLTNSLGGENVAGTALKSSPTDVPAWDGTNSSGFSALPGGYRSYNDGNFFNLGNYGYWWSSSPSGSGAGSRNLYSGNSYVYLSYNYVRNGFSVRCVRD
jgi:uncharacterized protein (TIGR02145 family)